MADYEVCETGVWVTQDGAVVYAAPDGPGKLIVPPGGLMRPDRVRAVEAAKAAAPQVVEESVTDPAPADEKPKRGRAKSDG